MNCSLDLGTVVIISIFDEEETSACGAGRMATLNFAALPSLSSAVMDFELSTFPVKWSETNI